MTRLHDLAARTPGLPCRTTDPELWFSKSSNERALAVDLCRECPLQRPCAQYALDHPEVRGVWGGTTTADRREWATGEPWRFDAQGRLRLLCGSERAYRSHFAYREQPGADCVDGDCVAAHEALVEAQRRERLAVEHMAGGSVRGYWLHRRLGEPACEACLAVWAKRSARTRRSSPQQGRRRTRGARPAPAPAEAVPGAPAGAQAA